LASYFFAVGRAVKHIVEPVEVMQAVSHTCTKVRIFPQLGEQGLLFPKLTDTKWPELGLIELGEMRWGIEVV